MKNILLLEDDIQLSETIVAFLSHMGYDVYCAYNTLQAEEVLYEKHIDLMLLDVKVPGAGGFDFLKKVRNEQQQIPAIFITSLHSVEDVEKGFASGCDDYMRKPFALKELAVRVASLLKRSYGTRHERVALGERLAFDLREMQLFAGEEHIPLKAKECKLLSLFLQNSDKLIRYDAINAALWEYGEEPSSGALRTYIKNLRALIGKERIETIKNVGYRFVSK